MHTHKKLRTMDNEEVYCPGGDHIIEGYPALSRYGHGDICSNCGTLEALLGDFIAQQRHITHG